CAGGRRLGAGRQHGPDLHQHGGFLDPVVIMFPAAAAVELNEILLALLDQGAPFCGDPVQAAEGFARPSSSPFSDTGISVGMLTPRAIAGQPGSTLILELCTDSTRFRWAFQVAAGPKENPPGGVAGRVSRIGAGGSGGGSADRGL